MSFTQLIVADDGAVRRITINRPDKLNALDATVIDELTRAFDAAADDPGVRVVVLTGAGPKAFVAGADIAGMAKLSAREGEAFAQLGQSVFAALEALPLPVIAAVNGSNSNRSPMTGPRKKIMKSVTMIGRPRQISM